MEKEKKLRLMKSKLMMFARGLRQARAHGDFEAVQQWENGISSIKKEIHHLEME